MDQQIFPTTGPVDEDRSLSHDRASGAAPLALAAPVFTEVPQLDIYDTSAPDIGLSAGGQVLATDADGSSDAITYALIGGVLDGTTWTLTSPLGVLRLDSISGHYEFVAGDAQLNGLPLGATVSIMYTIEATDADNNSATTSLTVQLIGADDDPVITEIQASATEASGVSNRVAGTNPTGNLLGAIQDADFFTTHVVGGIRTGAPGDSGTAGTWNGNRIELAGLYGTITLLDDGSWSYEVNNTDAQVDALRSGESLTDHFTFDLVETGPEAKLFSGALDVTILGADDYAHMTGEPPPNFTARDGEDTAFQMSQFRLVDPDGGTEIYRIGVVVSSGTLRVESTPGVTISGNGSGVIILSGTVDALNAILAADSFVFRPIPGRTSGESTLTLSWSPNGAPYEPMGGATITYQPARTGEPPIPDLNGPGDGNDVSTTVMTHGGDHTPLSSLLIRDGDSIRMVEATVRIDVPAGETTEHDNLFFSAAALSTLADNGITVTTVRDATSISLTITGNASGIVYDTALRGVTYTHDDLDRLDGTRRLTLTVTDEQGNVSGDRNITLAEENTAIAVGQRILVDGKNSGALVTQIIDGTHIVTTGSVAGLYVGANLTFHTGIHFVTSAVSASAGHSVGTITLKGHLIPDLNGTGTPGLDHVQTYTEDAGFQALVDPDVTIDAGSFQLGRIRVALTNPQDNDGDTVEFLSIDAAGLTQLETLGMSVHSHDGRLDGSGNLVDVTVIEIRAVSTVTASVAQEALKLLGYVNTSQAPDVTPRIITVQLADGDGRYGVTSQIEVTLVPVNDAPVLTVTASPELVVETMASVALFAPGTIVLTDPDAGAGLTSAIVTLTDAKDGAAEAISASDATFTATSGTVLTLTGAGTAGHPLVISGPGSHADYLEALQSLVYTNAHSSPTGGTRQVSLMVTDDTGASSTLAQVTLNVARAPMVDLNGAGTSGTDYAITYTERDLPTFIAGADATIQDADGLIRSLDVQLFGRLNGIEEVLTLSDDVVQTLQDAGLTVDGNDSGWIKLSLATGADPELFQSALRAITYHNTSARPTDASRTVTVTATDIDGHVSEVATTTITVIPVNQPARYFLTLSWPGKGLHGPMVGGAVTLSGTFEDDEGSYSGVVTKYKVDGDLVWTGESYTPRPEDVGKILSVEMSFIDGEGNLESIAFTVPQRIGISTVLPDTGGLATGTAGDDLLQGGAGDDSLYGGAGDDLLYGGAGDDSLYGNQDNDSLDGGAGNDWLKGGLGDDTLYGGDGDDRLMGSSGNDSLYGNQGNDTLFGGLGDDWIKGGLGDDQLQGGDGNDRLIGSAGNDTLYGKEGDDLLYGGLGDDWMEGGSGDDQFKGGYGNDILIGGQGDDTLFGNQDHDTLDGGRGDDVLAGGVGDDALYGGKGRDTLDGGRGDDVLEGGQGDDMLYGGKGRDTLSGGAGVDTLTGGAGADVFVFASLDGNNVDVITDFTQGQDRIGLGANIAALVKADGRSLAELVVWDEDNQLLSLDLSSGRIDLATLSNASGLTISAEDFVLM